MQLFRASRRFNVEIQPQLVLLQKTLLNIEGFGRMLDPELDLWTTAKPFLERWMEDQIGPFRAQAPAASPRRRTSSSALPELPRLIHQWLLAKPPSIDEAARDLASAQRTRNALLAVIAVLLAAVVGLLVWRPF